MTDVETYISVSGGVESTTCCILYGANAKGIWADTGSEHSLMYDRINMLEGEIRKIHPGFEIIRVKGRVKHKGDYYDNLESLATAYKYLPSGQKRHCTKYFKIEPIDKYLKSLGECNLIIGLNADEVSSREGNWGMNENVNYLYPLIDDGYTRSDCEAILHNHGLHPNMPIYMGRGGCRMCFFKSKKEYKAMYFFSRVEFNEVMEFEEGLQDRRDKFFTIMPNGQSMRMLAEECEREKMLFDDIETFYSSVKNETSCGAFCHR